MPDYKDTLPGLLVPLLKGVIYRDDNLQDWQNLVELQGAVQDYLTVIGLKMELDEQEGFAFLKNREREEGEDFPQLITRRQLSYPVSLLLVQLRRKLTEHDASSGEVRLVLEKQELLNMMATFFPGGSNEVKFQRQFEGWLQKASDLGFIRFLDDRKEKIEIKRIIKAFVDAQWLNEFDERMKEYAEYAGLETGGEEDDE